MSPQELSALVQIIMTTVFSPGGHKSVERTLLQAYAAGRKSMQTECMKECDDWARMAEHHGYTGPSVARRIREEIADLDKPEPCFEQELGRTIRKDPENG